MQKYIKTLLLSVIGYNKTNNCLFKIYCRLYRWDFPRDTKYY